MASIKKRPDSALYVACFTLPDGARKQVSTHTTDANEARQIAESYERASGLARQRRLGMRTAKQVVAQIAALSGSDIGGECVSLRLFLDGQLKALAGTHTARSGAPNRTLERYTYALEHFRDKSGLDAEPIDNITQAHAADWRDALKAEGLAPATINHQLGTIRRAFDEAVRREMIGRNPFDHASVAGGKSKKQRREAFTFEQFRALLDALELADCPVTHADEWRLLVMVAGYTGQRKNDCVKLKGPAFDFKRGVVRFWRSKNQNFHEVAMHPALAASMPKACKRAGKGLLFPALAALPPTGRDSSTDVFRQQVLPLVGIVQPYSEAGASRGRKIAPYSFHSLRHSLSSWLNSAGVSQADRMALVGHEDARVSDGYTHTGLENARRAIALIPSPTGSVET